MQTCCRRPTGRAGLSGSRRGGRTEGPDGSTRRGATEMMRRTEAPSGVTSTSSILSPTASGAPRPRRYEPPAAAPPGWQAPLRRRRPPAPDPAPPAPAPPAAPPASDPITVPADTTEEPRWLVTTVESAVPPPPPPRCYDEPAGAVLAVGTGDGHPAVVATTAPEGFPLPVA